MTALSLKPSYFNIPEAIALAVEWAWGERMDQCGLNF